MTLAVYVDFRTEISLPETAAFALVDVAGPPVSIQIMSGLRRRWTSVPAPIFLSRVDEDSHVPALTFVNSVILAALVAAS